MKHAWIMAGLLALSFAAQAGNGIETRASRYGFQETQARLESVLKEKGLTVFARIDHAEGARKVGLDLRPAIVTIFGNPKGGTPFMVAAPESALDFPLKALVREDASGKVTVSYGTLAEIVARHDIRGQDELAKKLDGLQAAIVRAATE